MTESYTEASLPGLVSARRGGAEAGIQDYENKMPTRRDGDSGYRVKLCRQGENQKSDGMGGGCNLNKKTHLNLASVEGGI